MKGNQIHQWLGCTPTSSIADRSVNHWIVRSRLVYLQAAIIQVECSLSAASSDKHTHTHHMQRSLYLLKREVFLDIKCSIIFSINKDNFQKEAKKITSLKSNLLFPIRYLCMEIGGHHCRSFQVEFLIGQSVSGLINSCYEWAKHQDKHIWFCVLKTDIIKKFWMQKILPCYYIVVDVLYTLSSVHAMASAHNRVRYWGFLCVLLVTLKALTNYKIFVNLMLFTWYRSFLIFFLSMFFFQSSKTTAVTIRPTPPSNETNTTTQYIPLYPLDPAETVETNLTQTHSPPLACEHVITTYVIPNFLHFIAYIMGFIYFRIQDNEHLYALMEKVCMGIH